MYPGCKLRQRKKMVARTRAYRRMLFFGNYVFEGPRGANRSSLKLVNVADQGLNNYAPTSPVSWWTEALKLLRKPPMSRSNIDMVLMRDPTTIPLYFHSDACSYNGVAEVPIIVKSWHMLEQSCMYTCIHLTYLAHHPLVVFVLLLSTPVLGYPWHS